jgi:DNA-binding GntR family transcriptional regulator
MNLFSNIALSMAIPESLAKLLEEEIIFGRLPPSARLTEEDVAARYNVSRSPVREALRLLERDGLVLRAARRGIWVAPLSVRDLDEIYICRVELEGIAAEQAAQSQRDDKKTKFSGLLSRLEKAHKEKDPREFFLVDMEGSFLTYELAANKTLTRLLGSLEKQAMRYRYLAYDRNPQIVEMSLQGTAEIYEAIVACDDAAAKAMTEDLIRNIWHVLRSTMADVFSEGGSND